MMSVVAGKLKYFRVLDTDDIVHVIAAPSHSKAWRFAWEAGIDYVSCIEVEESSVENLGLPLGQEGILK